MRRLLVVAVVLLALLLAVDRAGAALATRAVASAVLSSGQVDGRPSVSFGGFPLLTQALSGRYDANSLSGAGLADEQGVSSFDAQLSGVELPLSQALSGDVSQVPVERVTGGVLITYAELERRLGARRLTLSAAGDLLRVTGSVSVAGRTLQASALSSLAVSGSSVVVTAERFEVGNQPADRALSALLGKRFDFRFSVGKLPYDLQLRSVAVQPGGVRAEATAVSTVLTP